MADSILTLIPTVSEPEQKIFKLSLFGFKREDVLTYVSDLNKYSSDLALELNNSITKLEDCLAIARDENQGLNAKTKELEDQVNVEIVRANEYESQVQAMRLAVDRANDEAASYKSRLFASSQENTMLKADNARLNSSINALTATITEYELQKDTNDRIAQQAIFDAEIIKQKADDDAEFVKRTAYDEAKIIKQKADDDAEFVKRMADDEAKIIKQKADDDAKLTRDKASNDAINLIAAAEKEKSEVKESINASAHNIAISVSTIKSELNAVDAKIASAINELNHITSGISNALSITENDLSALGMQLEEFPSPIAPIMHTPPPAPHQPRHQKRPDTVSESILSKLVKLLR